MSATHTHSLSVCLSVYLQGFSFTTVLIHYEERLVARITVNTLSSSSPSLVWLQQTRIGLSLFDMQGQGFITEPVREQQVLSVPCVILSIVTVLGEVHPGPDPHLASARLPRRVLLCILYLHCSQEIFLLFGPPAFR